MIHLLHFYFQSLLLFLGLLGLLSVGTLIVRTKLKRKSENENENESLRRFWTELNTDINLTSKFLLTLIACTISFSAGYIWKDYEFSRNRYLYTNVLVLDKQDNQHFTLRPERMSAWEYVSCVPMDWNKSEKMKRLHFQWRKESGQDCKDATESGDYEFYSSQGKRILYEEEVADVY